MIAARVLRGLLLVGLAAIALLLLRDGGGGGMGTLVVGEGEEDRLAEALASARPPDRIAWSDAAGPGARAAWLLMPGPAIPPLDVPVGAVTGLRARAPARPVAGRAAALSVALDGAAGDTVEVRWRDLLGRVERRAVALGPGGRARMGLRVRPARSGWQPWTVVAGSDSLEVGAWVRPERPVRVLALAGAPDWEARFALRALDEAGLDVDARFDLGRVEVGRVEPGRAEPDPAAYDVVLLLAGAEPSPATTRELAAFARRGGGVLVAPGQPPGGAPEGISPVAALLSTLGLAGSLAPGPPLAPGAEPAWALPAELGPLPRAPVRAALVALGEVDPSARVVARAAPGGPEVAAVRALGRGRVAVLGLPETWRWRMEGGELDAHRAWWSAWVEWAASGAHGSLVATISEGPVPVGAVVRVRVEALEADVAIPRSLRLERPGGAVESVPVQRSGQQGEAFFLAVEPGEHRVTWEGGETGVLAADRRPAPDPAERALLALGSRAGGRPLPHGNGARGAPGRGNDPQPLYLWLGVLLGSLALAEWTLRRLRGGS